MSLTSGNVPSLIQGVSQQPASLRLATQLESQVNCLSSVVEGLTNRPPTEHIAKVSTTPLDDAFMHSINRALTQRYKAIVSDGLLRVFGIDGVEKTINALDETIPILSASVAIEDGATFQIYPATGETSIDVVVSGITTATVKFQLSEDGVVWDDIQTFTVSGSYTATIGTYLYMRAIVSAWTSGSITVTSTYKNFRYLSGATPKTSMRALTVADYTFLVNTTKTPAMSTTLSATRDYEGLVFVKKGEYGSTYKVFIDGTERATYTTSTTDSTTLTTTNIATDLYNDLVAWAGAGFVFTLVGSVIRISKATADFTLRTQDGQGGTSCVAFKGKTEKFSNLPATAPDGFVIAIDGDPENDLGQYFVKAVVNQTGETFGPVTWEECVQKGIPYAIDPTTMPYGLVLEQNGTFTYQSLAWADRICGDEDTNTDPSFIGSPINDVFYFKNRLLFLADEYFSFSETAEYFNFFRTTVTQVLDTDPVDARTTSTKVSILKSAVPFNKGLILFSDQAQFEIPGEVALTPKTIRADQVSAFEADLTSRPVASGSVIYFMFNRESYAGMRELYVTNVSEDMDASEVTDHVPSYIPAGVFSVSNSTLAGISALLTTGDPTSIYIYKTAWVKEKKVQSAWFRWAFDDYTASTTKILSADFIDTTLYLLVQRNGEVFLEKIRLIPNRTDPYVSYVTLIDRRMTEDDLTTPPTYDAATNLTTLALPYPITSTEMMVVTRGVADNTGFADVGRGLTIGTATVGSSSVTVRGDFSTNPLWIGQRYYCEAELSPLYIRKQTANGGQVIDAVSKLQLLKGTLVYSNSGYFRVSVTPVGRSTSHYPFTGRVVGDIANILGTVSLRSGKFLFSILSNNENVTITVNSNAFLPFRLSSMDWEGTYTKRSGG